MLPERRHAIASLLSFIYSPVASRWIMQYIDILWLVAALPPLVVAAYFNVFPVLFHLIAAIAILQFWHSTFRYRLKGMGLEQRSRFVSVHNLLQGALFVLLLPLDIGPWQLIMTVSFGTLFGDQLFGGRGFTFLNPVVTGLSFYLFSFSLSLEETAIALVHPGLIAPGIIGLLLFGLLSLRTVIGMLIGAAIVLLLQGNSAISIQLLIGSSAAWLALIFLAGDPGSGGSSDAARWIHSLLVGVLVLLLASTAPGQLSAFVYAILLASLSAPLIDYVVMQLHVRRRLRLHTVRRESAGQLPKP